MGKVSKPAEATVSGLNPVSQCKKSAEDKQECFVIKLKTLWRQKTCKMRNKSS